jgi:RecB family exonuclease
MDYAPASGLGQNRGSIGHAALAKWYKEGCDDEACLKLIADMYTQVELEYDTSLQEDYELLDLILRRYFAWARENDNFAEIVSLEQKFEIQIGGQPVIGYIDGVVRSNSGSIWLLEHKFNKQVSTRHIDLDPQMSLYLLAARTMGIDARGVLFNVIRVAEGGIAAKQPVERVKVYRNSEGLSYIYEEVESQVAEMADFHDNGIGHIYRNPTKDCSWDCPFFNVCLSVNDNGDADSVLATIPIIHRDTTEDDKGEQNG